MGIKEKSILLAGILFLLMPVAAAFAHYEDLPAVQLKLEKDRMVLLHEGQRHFYPTNEFDGIKQLDQSYDLNGDGKSEYILGIQLLEPETVGGMLISEATDKKV